MEQSSNYTLADLIGGSQQVNALSVDKGHNIHNYEVQDVRFQRFLGTKSIQSGALVRSEDGAKAYSVQVYFYGLEADDKPSFGSTKARVHCSCPMFYYYYAYDDHEKGAHVGRTPREYEPVPPDKRKRKPGPPLNPNGVPGVCKHIVAFVDLLRGGGYVTD